MQAAATHGVFAQAANTALAGPDLDRIVICDTVPPLRLTDPAVQDDLFDDYAIRMAEWPLRHEDDIDLWLIGGLAEVEIEDAALNSLRGRLVASRRAAQFAEARA